MTTITKKQIALKVAQRKGMDPKEVQRTIQEFLNSVTESLVEGNRFEFRVRNTKKVFIFSLIFDFIIALA